jgi:WD40 repeat protein
VDKNIKLWSKETGVCELTININEIVETVVQLKDGQICCGDYHGSIKIWNITTRVCEMALNGHAIVVIDELRVWSYSNDKTIKMWNVSSGVCEKALKGHACGLMDMMLLQDGRLCSVGYEGCARIWNNDAGVCELSIQVCYPSALYKVVQLPDGRLVVCDMSGVVHIIGE